MAETQRLFVCIDVPDVVVKAVAQVQEQLNKKLKFIGKSTELENLHLTLKFLGEVDHASIEQIDKTLTEVRFSPFTARLGSIGAFTYKGQPKIIWIKVLGKIMGLQHDIDQKLSRLFPLEERFMSHMTITRIRYVQDVTYARQYLHHVRLPSIAFTVDTFKLKRSFLRAGGPVYETLREYRANN